MFYTETVNSDYKVIDLFAGSGGSALGFSQAGFNIAAAVDVEKIATETFKHNFPDAKVFCSDIRDITREMFFDSVAELDSDHLIMIACPPCQGFSTARRKAEAKTDPRNTLIYEFVRLVKETNPLAFVMENVPGLAKGLGRDVFNITLKELDSLGYRTSYDVVDCADYGIPQHRRRLVLIGTRHSEMRLNFPSKTNQNPDLPDTYLPAWKTVRESISDLPLVQAGETSQNDIQHVSANLSDVNLQRLSHTPHDGGDRSSWPDELILECHRNINGYKDVYGRMKWDAPSPTITGGCAMISKGRYGHPEQNRAITLREAARLQTFPDNFIFKGNFGEVAKQIGNAVPPLLAKRMADSLNVALHNLNVFNEVLGEKNSFTSFFNQSAAALQSSSGICLDS